MCPVWELFPSPGPAPSCTPFLAHCPPTRGLLLLLQLSLYGISPASISFAFSV